MQLPAGAVIGALALASDAIALQSSVPPVPLPLHEQRPLARRESFARFTFEREAEGFVAIHACELAARDGLLQVRAFGDDPWIHSQPLAAPACDLVELRLVARASRGAALRVYWTTAADPIWNEAKACAGTLAGDGVMRETTTLLPIGGALRQLRLDPFEGAGEFAIDEFELRRVDSCPVRIERVSATFGRDAAAPISIQLLNESALDVRVRGFGSEPLVPAGGRAVLRHTPVGQRLFDLVPIEFAVADFAPFVGSITTVDRASWQPGRSISDGRLQVEIAPDGSGATLFLVDRPIPTPDFHNAIAFLAPLLARVDADDGTLRPLEDPVVHIVDATHARLIARGASVYLEARDGQLLAHVHAEFPVEALAVRLSELPTRSLVCGVEYLGANERSSSSLDLEGPARLRYAPDPAHVTWPLMAAEIGSVAIGLTWERRDLQPIFAQPNVVDGDAGTRFALRGSGDWKAELQVVKPRAAPAIDRPLEALIAKVVTARRLPLPRPQRPTAEQWTLVRAALDGPLASAQGWGHCAEPNWPRAHYASMAATRWRLDDALPSLPPDAAAAPLADGGTHHRDDAAWFLHRRAAEWIDLRQREADALITAVEADGRWHERGRFARGHFEATALGLCARNSADLLEHAWLSGDLTSWRRGMVTLERLIQFDLPRGAQTWELPLHAPDLLAAAHAVRANVLGYRLMAEDEARSTEPAGDDFKAARWLAEARRHALLGLPFVYLWGTANSAPAAGKAPIDDYATIAAYAATNWQAPVWIGLPVQWCGLVYARALAELAPLDPTFPWATIARGILATGEAMQHVDGPLIGCLPDAFRLADQVPLPASINPCTLANLRLQLDGVAHDLARVRVLRHVVVGPWPMTARTSASGNGSVQLDVHAPAGSHYQLAVDGKRIVDASGPTSLEFD